VPAITFHGGPLLTNVGVEAVFYGDGWQNDSNLAARTGDIANFLTDITNSSYMDMLSNAGYNVGRGSYLDSTTIPADLSSGSVDDSQVQTDLNAAIDNGSLQQPDANRLYIVFVQPGVQVTRGDGVAVPGAGYHEGFTATDGSTDALAIVTVVDQPNDPWPAQMNQIALLTTHELAEAVTDPVGGGWYDDQGPAAAAGESEIADYVNGQGVFLDGYLVHKVVDQNEQPLVPDGSTNMQAIGQDAAATTGQEYNGTVAIFQDADQTGSVGDYTAQITWGDGQTSDGQVVDNGDGTLSVTGANTYGQSGSYTVQVQITDTADGDTAAASSTATVNDPSSPNLTATGQDVTATAGQEYNGTVATFQDADGTGSAGDYTAQIDWGDGQTSAGQVVDNGDGTFSVTGANTYGQAGSYTIQVQITDTGEGDTAAATSTATVQAAYVPDLAAQGQDLAATAGQAYTGTVATITDPDHSGSVGDYSATISWGDGQTSVGQVVDNGDGTFAVTGSNTYQQGGSYTVGVQIQDAADGDNVATGGTATIAAASDPGTANPLPGNPAPAHLAEVASALTHSTEYYQNLITATYQKYLGRNPEPAGMAVWVQAKQNGLSDESLEAGFIGSQEYIANHGGSGAGWVEGMYQDLLGRTPGADEVNAWVRNLQNGMAPQQVAYFFAHSAEREGQRITADYETYLGREPENQDIVNAWVNAFESGTSNEDVIAGFVGSAEYYQSHSGTNDGWLDSAFQDILGRPATAADLQVWLPVLES
jgi:hypothetical protein